MLLNACKSRLTGLGALRPLSVHSNIFKRKDQVESFTFIQSRNLSTNDVFTTKIGQNMIIPDAPLAPLPKPSVEQLITQGQSVLTELGLFEWYKPTGYIRYLMEQSHVLLDLPWWSVIIAGTISLRLLLIYVPVLSQRNAAIQSKYRTEMTQYKDRIQEARAEGNQQLAQQTLIDQQRFLKSKGIKLGRQMMILVGNGVVFMTQFFAIKKMADVAYPGWETGGIWWFENLCQADPYYILPAVSALTMHIVLKSGIETGASADQLPPVMRLGMQYGIPVVVFMAAMNFPSALGVYWVTSNGISFAFSKLFKVTAVRNAFNIPMMHVAPQTMSTKATFGEAWKNYKSYSGAPPSISKVREQDAINFKKAGQAKPFTK
uniref:Mitochondrial inner membrane protein OXA1 n=1 Tax=Rhabditophanes sp. KR3021 TaxID=114890 RepID=A0AC35U251_9BILA